MILLMYDTDMASMGEDDSGFTLEAVDVAVYTVPTDQPEADGTLAWDSTTVVVVEPRTRDGTTGLGYAIGDTATGALVRDTLAGVCGWRRPARPSSCRCRATADHRSMPT